MVDGERWIVRARSVIRLCATDESGACRGAFFAEQDTCGSSPRVAVISQELAGFLFGDVDVVGRAINLRPADEMSLARLLASRRLAEALAMPGDDVEIIGVFGQTDLFERCWRSDRRSNAGARHDGRHARPLCAPYTEIFFRAREGMDREAEEEVRRLLMSRLAQRGDNQRTMDGMSLEVLVTARGAPAPAAAGAAARTLVLGGLGLAALVVSSIAVFTTTLANLAPRTRYIGLSRALGATRSRIVRKWSRVARCWPAWAASSAPSRRFRCDSTVFSPLFSSLPGERAAGRGGRAAGRSGGRGAGQWPSARWRRCIRRGPWPAWRRPIAWREGTV